MYDDLLRKPFQDGGRGPGAYDCWGLLREVYRRNGIDIPDINVSIFACREAQAAIDAEKVVNWREIHHLQTPCAVLMVGAHGFANHIGAHIGNGQVIHTGIRTGVVVDRLSQLKPKITGFWQYGDYDFSS